MTTTPRLGLLLLAVAPLLLAQCQSDTASLQPLAWVKVAGPTSERAMMDPGAVGDFDQGGTFTERAIPDGAAVTLYYGGADTTGACAGINAAHWRIGRATSADGLHFDKQPGPYTGGAILDLGDPGRFDDYLSYRPFVLHDGALWRMWYNGSRKPFNCPSGTLADDRRIGYAESNDGVTWTRRYDLGQAADGSALPLGAPGAIDAQQVGYAWILKDGEQYKLYYSANDSNNFWRVRLAVSTDAHTWTKVQGKQFGGAILDVGPTGAFDAFCAYQPSVVKERDQLYRMWYRGCETAGTFGGPSRGTIGYAESNDGITWVKIPQPTATGAALLQGATGDFDESGLTTPSVYLEGSTWTMFYAGFNHLGHYRIGKAQAVQP